jgi:glycosyltransferase involved in cell wall biosynthesis
MSNARIAVVIPGYNHADFIGAGIASVLAQDWPELELQVLDDGSSDDTAGAALRAVAGQTRVRARIERQENQGSSATLNRLIERVDADYVAVLNSDDLYHPGRLAALAAAAAGRDLFFGTTGVDFITGGETADFALFADWYRSKLDYARQLPTCGFALLTSNFAITSSNFFFSRELFDLVGGFSPELSLTQDWHFMMECLRWVEPTLLPARLMSYRVHPNNTWRRLQEQRAEQSRSVLRSFARWAGEATLNKLAPTSVNWPGFFPYFVRICGSLLSDTPVGADLPAALLAQPPGGGGQRPADLAAIARLLAAAQPGRASPSTEPIEELLAAVAARWGEGRSA